jgi:RNA polymerase-interacting CarD/CdnL/TRCF family regulator
MSKFDEGDLVCGNEYPISSYMGLSKTIVGGKEYNLHMLLDQDRNVKYYVNDDKIQLLHKLPSKRIIENAIKQLFNDKIKYNKKINPQDRYQTLVDNLDGSFKKAVGALQQLNLVKQKTELSLSEKKLMGKLSKRFLSETNMVLGTKYTKLEELLPQ